MMYSRRHLLYTITFVGANLLGQPLLERERYDLNYYSIMYQHGWPYTFLVRQPTVASGLKDLATWDLGPAYAKVDYGALVQNVILFVLFLVIDQNVAIASASTPHNLQFRLKHVFFAILVIASSLRKTLIPGAFGNCSVYGFPLPYV